MVDIVIAHDLTCIYYQPLICLSTVDITHFTL